MAMRQLTFFTCALFIVCAMMASCAFASINSLPEETYKSFFSSWQNEHNKVYDSSEFQKRYAIWKENLDWVRDWTANNPHASFTVGMNAFSDLTQEEFDNIYASPLSLTSLSMNKGHGLTHHALDGVTVPPSIDWREKGAVTRVKNQGQCGSCYTFSVTGAIEGLHWNKTRTLVSLSEQQILDCTRKYGNAGCSGGWMNVSFQQVIDVGGIESEATYPYEGVERQCRYNPQNRAASVSKYVEIAPGNENQLKEALGTYGPVSVAFDASRTSFRFYTSGIYSDPACDPRYMVHAVVAVGYGTEGGKDYYIAKNSWDVTWGDKGYFKIARNAGNMCGFATAASYPL